tara:strand:+ start:347 stop:475 length:129 start_codon:yes stop_codon:yes gene_type:complete
LQIFLLDPYGIEGFYLQMKVSYFQFAKETTVIGVIGNDIFLG